LFLSYLCSVILVNDTIFFVLWVNILLGILVFGFQEKESNMYVVEILLLECLIVNNIESGTKDISVDM